MDMSGLFVFLLFIVSTISSEDKYKSSKNGTLQENNRNIYSLTMNTINFWFSKHKNTSDSSPAVGKVFDVGSVNKCESAVEVPFKRNKHIAAAINPTEKENSQHLLKKHETATTVSPKEESRIENNSKTNKIVIPTTATIILTTQLPPTLPTTPSSIKKTNKKVLNNSNSKINESASNASNYQTLEMNKSDAKVITEILSKYVKTRRTLSQTKNIEFPVSSLLEEKIRTSPKLLFRSLFDNYVGRKIFLSEKNNITASPHATKNMMKVLSTDNKDNKRDLLQKVEDIKEHKQSYEKSRIFQEHFRTGSKSNFLILKLLQDHDLGKQVSKDLKDNNSKGLFFYFNLPTPLSIV